ncbi:Thymus-specific serine protease [Perkinsus olseni]|uniref:Thymus-specific serine protease n=1 Tax=Perkinsus olseni TaxID=32597 RepID=A0A7J6LXI5_PEROL|nr:Thymus-specific serine protease [Perkinsus olseni]
MPYIIILVLALKLLLTEAGPLTYGICQAGCAAAWVSCNAACGVVAGTVTAGAATPACVLACNGAQGACYAACAAMVLTPTPESEANEAVPRESAFDEPTWENRKYCGQLVDHNLGGRSPKFCQTYYYTEEFVDTAYQSPPPAIFMEVSNLKHADTDDVDAGMIHCAAALGAIPVYLEMRFFGKSLPIRHNFNADNLKRLFTHEQFIEDMQRLAEHLRNRILGRWKAPPKFVIFGNSLTGRVATWARVTYPRVFVGAVASSSAVEGVVECKDNIVCFPSFNDRVAAAFANEIIGGSPECLQAVTRAHEIFGNHLHTAAGRKQLVEIFGLSEGDLDDPRDQWMRTGNGLLGFAVKANDPTCPDPYCNVAKICEKMVAVAAEAVAGSESEEQRWLEALATIENANTPPSNDKTPNIKARIEWVRNSATRGHDKLHWFLKCTQFPTFDTCSTGSQCPWVRMNDSLKYFFSICEDAFDITREEVARESAETNRKYGGKTLNNTDNILSINGDVDPWLSLSVTQSQPGSPAITIPGAGHALWALMSKIDDSDFKKYYDEILDVVSGWLEPKKPARLRRGSQL